MIEAELALARRVKGFMPQDEGLALHDAGRAASAVGPLLEIGSYCGKSAVYLGTAARDGGTVLFTVDHHHGSEENQAGWEHHDPEVVDPGRDLADRLSRVGVHGNSVLTGDRCNLRYRLDRTDLVVCVHDADEAAVRGDRLADVVGIDEALRVDPHIGDRRAQALQIAAWFECRRMLDLGGDHVRGTATTSKEQALQGEIVGFAAAAREHDFIRRTAEECGHLAAGGLQGSLRRCARPVTARGIAIRTFQQGPHGRGDRGINGCARVVVEVDRRRRRQCH